MNIADLRREYMRAGLAEADAHADPLVQFERWFREAEAAQVPLPNAMTLATVDAGGAPSARVVLLKAIEHGGFTFYSNYLSRKGRELAARPRACLVFLWSELERQVRVEGAVERVPAHESDAYFASRPLGARLSAWASRQSEPIADRAVLERTVDEVASRFGEGDVELPPFWGGYLVRPDEVELWQHRDDRLHDRIAYMRTPDGDGWTRTRLQP